jgi:hypothetical protein
MLLLSFSCIAFVIFFSSIPLQQRCPITEMRPRKKNTQSYLPLFCVGTQKSEREREAGKERKEKKSPCEQPKCCLLAEQNENGREMMWLVSFFRVQSLLEI